MFNQLANFLKHEQPFLGVVSQVEYLHDLYDANTRGLCGAGSGLWQGFKV